MKIEKGEISSSQLTFLIGGFIHSTALLGGFSAGITKQDTWLAVLAGSLVSLPFVLVYLGLMKRFPGDNLMQILELIYGPYLGKAVSMLYIFVFFQITFENLRFTADLLLTYVMPETPLIVMLIIFTFLSAWVTRKGIEVIARCSIIPAAIVITVISLSFILLIKDMDFKNFLPVLDIPPMAFVQGTHIIVAIPFCEIMVFMMIIPYVNKAKQAKKASLLGFAAATVTYTIVGVRNIAVLGPLYSITASPSIEAVRLIHIANILTRLEVLIVIALVFMLFLKTSVLFYSVVLGIAQTFRLHTYTPLVFPVGIILILNAVVEFDSSMEQYYAAANIWPFYVAVFEFVIPVLSLIIARIRRLPKRNGESCI